MSLKPKSDPADRRPLIATLHNAGTGTESTGRATGPARHKSPHERAGEGSPTEEGGTAVIRLKHKRDPRDRIPLVPSKRELERGAEPT